MTAIMLSKNNLEATTETDTSIVEFNIEAMINENENPLYFIPRWDESDQEYTGWALVPEDSFKETFDADMTKIETDFVEITRK